MAKRPTDEATPEGARTDSNVTRIPSAGRKGAAVPLVEGLSDDDLTADALRHALDRGEGGDKVDFSDPAAAPLGTDDEAAGFPPTRAQVAEAARHELGAHRPEEERQARRTIPDRAKGGVVPRLWMIVALLLLAVLVLSLFVDGL